MEKETKESDKYVYDLDSLKELKAELKCSRIFASDYLANTEKIGLYELEQGQEETYTNRFLRLHIDEMAPYSQNQDITNKINEALKENDILTIAQYAYNIEVKNFKDELKIYARIDKEFNLKILRFNYDKLAINEYLKAIENIDTISKDTEFLVIVNDAETYKKLKNKVDSVDSANIININGLLKYDLIVEEFTKRELDAPILLLFDLDDTHQANQAKLKKELQDNNFKVADFELAESDKKLNDIIQDEKFKAIFESNKKRLDKLISDSNDNLHTFLAKYVEIVENRSKNYKPIISGMTLDKYLDGGLYENQTFFIGAPSGVGKTAFCLQWATNIAKYEGQYVLYIALEQPRIDLVSRSISRMIFESHYKDAGIDLNNQENLKDNFLTMRDLTTGRFMKEGAKNNDKKFNLYIEEFRAFADIAHNKKLDIFDVKDSTDLFIETIEKKIDNYKKFVVKDNKLIVFIDYLQLINIDSNVKVFDATTKIDYIIAQIKRIANKENIIIVCISSNNRDSNKTENIGLENFRGSANIEYTADIAAQIYIDKDYYIKKYANDERFKEITKGKGKNSSEKDISDFIQKFTCKKYLFKILKSRNYIAPLTLKNFDFYGAYSFYDMSMLAPIADDYLDGFESYADNESEPKVINKAKYD